MFIGVAPTVLVNRKINIYGEIVCSILIAPRTQIIPVNLAAEWHNDCEEDVECDRKQPERLNVVQLVGQTSMCVCVCVFSW